MVNINALIVINVHWCCTFIFCRASNWSQSYPKEMKWRGRFVADKNGLCTIGFEGIAQIWGSRRQMLPPISFASKCFAVFVWHTPTPHPQETPWEYRGGMDWCHLWVFNICIWSYAILMSLRLTSSAPKQDCKTCFMFGVKSSAVLLHLHNPVLWPLLKKMCFRTWI